MDAAERKRLIAKGAENKNINEAIAEENRIIMSKPIQYMPHDPRLAHLPKAEAAKIIRTRKENMAKGLATINAEVAPKTEEAKKNAQEHPKVEKDAPIKEEKPKAPAKSKRSRSKKVE